MFSILLGGCEGMQKDKSSCSHIPQATCSNGTATCRPGYANNVYWTGISWSGSCDEVQCHHIEHATCTEGVATCEQAYSANIKWNGNSWEGSCQSIGCPDIPFAVCDNGIASCPESFTNSVSWNGSNWTGSCESIGCPDIELAVCENGVTTCPDYYVNSIEWNESTWQGDCIFDQNNFSIQALLSTKIISNNESNTINTITHTFSISMSFLNESIVPTEIKLNDQQMLNSEKMFTQKI